MNYTIKTAHTASIYQIPQRLAYAYKLTGIAPPQTPAEALTVALADAQSAADVSAALAVELATLAPAEVAKWAPKALARITAAEAEDRARSQLSAIGRRVGDEGQSQQATAIELLAGPLKDAASQLLQVVASLPEHDSLDADACQDHGTASEHLTIARDAVHALTAIAGVHITPSHPALPMQVRVLCSILDVVEVAGEIRGLGQGPAFNEAELTDTRQLRQIVGDCVANRDRSSEADTGQLLINLARGKYGDCQIRLAEDSNEVRLTADRIEQAVAIEITGDARKARALVDARH